MTTRYVFHHRAAALMLVAAGLLSACGGGSDSQPAATSEVPADASQTVAGFIGYLQRLVVSEADTLEPVDTSLVMAPTDDTGEPTQVD